MAPSSPLKVLHITAGNLYGGVEATLATFAAQSQWDKRLERSFAVCFRGRLSETLVAAGTAPAILGDVRTRYPWQVWRARRRLVALLRERRFDAVICHMAWSLAIFGPVVKGTEIPLIFWLHDVANSRHWVERWARRTSPDLVITNSRFTLASLPRIFPERLPHAIIHGPVSPPSRAEIPAAQRAAARRELQTPHGDVVIIQVGRLEPYKGHALHLEALAHLRDQPGWTCWIVGGAQRPQEKEYLARLQRQAREAGVGERVRFIGERRDVGRLLAAADIFCQPNQRGEPFGLVFVEALYAGLPVVTTAIGGALEIVDESCGRLVPPADPAALASVLRELIIDPALRSRLGASGPARAESLSHPDVVMGKIETALFRMVETGFPAAPGRRAIAALAP